MLTQVFTKRVVFAKARRYKVKVAVLLGQQRRGKGVNAEGAYGAGGQTRVNIGIV